MHGEPHAMLLQILIIEANQALLPVRFVSRAFAPSMER